MLVLMAAADEVVGVSVRPKIGISRISIFVMSDITNIDIRDVRYHEYRNRIPNTLNRGPWW